MASYCKRENFWGNSGENPNFLVFIKKLCYPRLIIYVRLDIVSIWLLITFVYVHRVSTVKTVKLHRIDVLVNRVTMVVYAVILAHDSNAPVQKVNQNS